MPKVRPTVTPPGRVDVFPATSERWADVATLMGGDAADRGCWCQYYRWSSSDYAALGAGGGRRALEAQVAAGPPPGLIAYLAGEPAGWCGIGPRASMERLVRSRTIPQVDEVPVWSIVCFLVRPGYRRRGVAKALLSGVVGHARAAGAPALEAYPIDAGGSRQDVTFSYVGFTSMFEAAGFRRIIETGSRSAGRPRWLMRLDLSATPDAGPDAAPPGDPA